MTTNSYLLAARLALLAARPGPQKLGVEIHNGKPPDRFKLRAIGDAFIEEINISQGEIDMDEVTGGAEQGPFRPQRGLCAANQLIKYRQLAGIPRGISMRRNMRLRLSGV
ncbi:hypothetical protein PAE1511 [Pyrobaculum aerophilum str. IM2]|uniref:Uncharacterized protein n=1 Tax=Pyrobaculum aerophilum (strain ATCC 51768 / DSM 7523 / JCM 9630 / CIP 104966 / NBRC 100827 / IM2) TaxID=178306 RepID=Q8ZX21_PYRAE|nr:hypothetical protein PAE1511 [Pyrobaculum aerophilum str. IM2]